MSLATAMIVTLVPSVGFTLAPAAATTTASTATWGDCPADVVVTGPDGAAAKCTTITVPMDYANPSAGTFNILATGFLPTGTPKGVILGNPGGPGGSALDFWRKDFFGGTPTEMYRDYALIALQPRGLEHATSDVCSTKTECEEVADQAYRRTLTTENVARDMDELRKAMGVDKISYYGASWGTQLGAAYATLFPSNVDKMVLDSNVNPATLGIGGGTFKIAASALAMERRLYDFFDWAAANNEVFGLGDTPYKVYSAWNTARLMEDSNSWVYNYLPPALREADLPEKLRPSAAAILADLNTVIQGVSKIDYAARLAAAVKSGEVYSLDAARGYGDSGLMTNALSMAYDRSSWSDYAAQIDFAMRPLAEASVMKLIEANKVSVEEIQAFAKRLAPRSAMVSDGAGLSGYQGTAVNENSITAAKNPAGTEPDPKYVALQEAAEKAYQDAIAAGESSASIQAKYMISEGYRFMGYGYVKTPEFSGAGLTTAPLLLQSLKDPATVAAGGRVLADQLGGNLITVDGGDHGLFRRTDGVLNQAVLDYFATGKVAITTAPETPVVATASPLARYRQLIAEIEGAAPPVVGPTIPDTQLNRLLSLFGPNVDADSVIPKPVFASPVTPAIEQPATEPAPAIAAGVTANAATPEVSTEADSTPAAATTEPSAPAATTTPAPEASSTTPATATAQPETPSTEATPAPSTTETGATETGATAPSATPADAGTATTAEATEKATSSAGEGSGS
ncbi:alpha/beta fold hydrolase [Tsukamurella sp. TY48]|uniref:alpha/beta fold hydrolase n=1 Tax=Tsukamurella TaxID=2060 RepID=UPI001C7CEDEA|nr:alpha/beta fold hydrolase [Tsukamurella sp. TY48]